MSSPRRRTRSLRGPRGGMILTNDEAIAKKVNSAVFPGLQGGPLMHVIAAKAVALRRGAAAGVQGLRQERRRERQGAGREPEVQGSRYRLRAAPTPSDAGRSAAEAPDRQGGRDRARPRPHHLQQERHPVRSREADGDLGRAARHAGRHDTRLRRRRIPPDRRHDRRSARRALAEGRRRGLDGRGGGARQGKGAGDALSDLPDKGEEGRPMRCPKCASLDTQVKDSRPTEDSAAIRRRRVCLLPVSLHHIRARAVARTRR